LAYFFTSPGPGVGKDTLDKDTGGGWGPVIIPLPMCIGFAGVAGNKELLGSDALVDGLIFGDLVLDAELETATLTGSEATFVGEPGAVKAKIEQP